MQYRLEKSASKVELYFFYITKLPQYFAWAKELAWVIVWQSPKKPFLDFFSILLTPKKCFLEIIRSRALLLPYLYFRSRALLSKQILSTQKKFQMDNGHCMFWNFKLYTPILQQKYASIDVQLYILQLSMPTFRQECLSKMKFTASKLVNWIEDFTLLTFNSIYHSETRIHELTRLSA